MVSTGVSRARLGVGIRVVGDYQRVQLSQNSHRWPLAAALNYAFNPGNRQTVPVRNPQFREFLELCREDQTIVDLVRITDDFSGFRAKYVGIGW